jgi:hypothetical protein
MSTTAAPTSQALADAVTFATDDPDGFRQHVANLVRNNNPLIWQTLLAPQVAQHTFAALGELYKDVTSQLAARSADHEVYKHSWYQEGGPQGQTDWYRAKADFQRWRAGAIRFKSSVEQRLSQAKLAAQTARQLKATTYNDIQARLHRDAVRRLAVAIWAHRQACQAEDIEPESHDLALWAALDRVTVPYYGGSATVSMLLDQGTWVEEEGL